MKNFAEKIIELRLATRKACNCEEQNAKKTLNLKSKFLFCIKDKPSTPSQLMNRLVIGKTNLAIMAKQLLAEGLIERTVTSADRRNVSYTITDKGKQHVDAVMQRIEELFSKILTDEKEYDDAIRYADELITLFSYLE